MPKEEAQTSSESKRGSSCSTAQLPKEMDHPVQQIELSAAAKATSKTDLSLELKKIASDKGFMISDNHGEGDCMFHALSEQLNLVKRIQISHEELRKTIVLNLKSNPKLPDGTELFNFVHGYSSWDAYLTKMMKAGTWGDHLILHGVANYFGTCIRVISSLSHQHDLIISPTRADNANSNRLVLGHIHEHHYVSLRPKRAVRPGHHPGTDEIYNMTARPRGVTLIINNNRFDRHPEHSRQSPRDGSEEDVCQVEALFDALGFHVHSKENVTRLQLLDELSSVACQDHSGYDCFVLWLMSHGKSGVVYGSDGVPLPIQSAHDMLSNCKTLVGKPKLFFIQACRGDEEDEGFAITTDRPSPKQDPRSQVDPPGDGDNPSASRISPTHADFLYSYATVDGYVSYRHKALGSYYVRAVVEVFRERATHDDLLGILTTVNRKVSELEMCDVKKFKQMPEYKSTLLKKLRF